MVSIGGLEGVLEGRVTFGSRGCMGWIGWKGYFWTSVAVEKNFAFGKGSGGGRSLAASWVVREIFVFSFGWWILRDLEDWVTCLYLGGWLEGWILGGFGGCASLCIKNFGGERWGRGS